MSAPPPQAAPPGAQAGGWPYATLTMYSPLSAIVRRAPVAVPLSASVREALEAMERARVGCIVVVEPERGVPLGIFTLQDLVRRVTLPGGDLEQPVAAVMTSGLITHEPQTSAHQAALTMARHGVRHVVVVDGAGRLAGVVSQNDLFSMQRVGVKEVSAEIQAASDPAGLERAARGIRRLADGLVAQGVGVETLCHFVTTLNDLLTVRAIELSADEHEVPAVPYCWIALGSEGRLEQTFHTDQDNALLFDAPDRDAQAVREILRPFAQAVNDKLHACGFPRCTGGIMAGNSRWCLTLAEWRRTFAGWIEKPSPEALLHSAVFFDFRPIYGAAPLAERLRDWLLPAVAERPVFLRMMAQNALSGRPPLGAFGSFVYDRTRQFAHTVDLKGGGSQVYSDAARILALARRVPHTSTAQRLRAVGERGYFGEEGLAALVDGFYFIHLLRLRSQCQPGRFRGAANRVDPRDLNELERHVLKEALRQAGKLQEYLVQEYQLRT